MAHVQPFRALHFPFETKSFQNLIAPPYDVISDQLKNTLRNRDPHNVVHLILGDQAGKTLREWRRQNVLVQDDTPSVYILEDQFNWQGETRIRRGILLTVKLEPFGQGPVVPHEKTLAAAIANRLALLSETETHLSPVYMVAPKTEELKNLFETTCSTSPTLTFNNKDEALHHRFLKCSDSNVVKKWVNAFSKQSLLIADGHHRYTTALSFAEKNENRLPEARWMLALVTLSPDPGVVLSAIHRFVDSQLPEEKFLSNIRMGFEVSQAPLSFDAFQASTAPIAWVKPNTQQMFLLNPKETNPLSTLAFSGGILNSCFGLDLNQARDQKAVQYFKNPDEVQSLCASRNGFAFWLKALTVDQVMDFSKTGQTLPQKSTFFYPKVMSGFVFHPLS